MQYSFTAVENRRSYEVGHVNVTDRDDPGTGNWEAKYSITNDHDGTFYISTDPVTNQGVLTVLKVQSEHVFKCFAESHLQCIILSTRFLQVHLQKAHTKTWRTNIDFAVVLQGTY